MQCRVQGLVSEFWKKFQITLFSNNTEAVSAAMATGTMQRERPQQKTGNVSSFERRAVALHN